MVLTLLTLWLSGKIRGHLRSLALKKMHLRCLKYIKLSAMCLCHSAHLSVCQVHRLQNAVRAIEQELLGYKYQSRPRVCAGISGKCSVATAACGDHLYCVCHTQLTFHCHFIEEFNLQHLVLTPTILPFQLNRQYISGRHVSLPMHPFI